MVTRSFEENFFYAFEKQREDNARKLNKGSGQKLRSMRTEKYQCRCLKETKYKVVENGPEIAKGRVGVGG